MVVVINGISEDGRIRDSEVKAQEEQHWRNHAQQEFAEMKEDSDLVTIGSHSNFLKGWQPLNLQKLRGK